MKKYNLTFTNLKGDLCLGYNETGFLILYENRTSMTDEAINWVLRNFATHESELNAFAQKCKATVELIPVDLSFNAFWNAYGKKINKIRCEILYKKLNETERLKCLQNVKHYDNYLQRSGFRAKADPENYLKKQYFLTDWRKER